MRGFGVGLPVPETSFEKLGPMPQASKCRETDRDFSSPVSALIAILYFSGIYPDRQSERERLDVCQCYAHMRMQQDHASPG